MPTKKTPGRRSAASHSKGSRVFHARATVETDARLAAFEDPENPRVLTDEEIEARLDAIRLRVPLPYQTQAGDYDWERDPASSAGYSQEDVQAMLRKISARQRSYGAARVHGESRAAAVRMLHVSAEAAKLWESAPWYDVLLAEERSRMFGDTKAAFEPLAPAVLRHYAKALDGEWGGEVAQSAARDVADRIFGKVPTNINQKIEGDMGGLSLVNFLKEIAEANRQMEAEQRALVAEVPVEQADWKEADAV